MLKEDLERRIRQLESALDQFSGLEWIIKVGEIAEIKSAVFNMTDAAEAQCASLITVAAVARLDQELHIAATTLDRAPNAVAKRAEIKRHRAFHSAYRLLQTWLGPALPTRRKEAAAQLFSAIGLEGG